MATTKTKRQLACRTCHSIHNGPISACPVCGSSQFTDDWAGYVVIAHPDRSEIAQLMGVTEPGRYALKVR